MQAALRFLLATTIAKNPIAETPTKMYGKLFMVKPVIGALVFTFKNPAKFAPSTRLNDPVLVAVFNVPFTFYL